MSTRQIFKISTIPAALLIATFLISCGNSPGLVNAVTASTAAPTVLAVVPQSNGVGTNREIAVVFSKAMNPASINASTFLVAGVTGTVTYDATNKIAAFKSSAPYAPDTEYNATITVGAKDTSGTPLAAPFVFSFATRATLDTSPPYVVAVNLAPGATCVPLDQKIVVTFNEQMDSLTINPSTFFINGVAGTVVYDVLTQTATFTPTASLATNTTYTITVTTGAQDMGSVPLNPPFSQTFTTCSGQSSGPQPVALCPNIGNFSVLAGSTVTNTGPTTISGDVGVSPGSSVTGFPPGQLTSGGTIHIADGAAALAQSTLANAYVDAAGRSGGTTEAGDLAGKTLTAGVYTSTSSLANTGDLTLDAQGNPNAVFIFQIGSTLTTGSGSHIILAHNASACNVFWQVGSSATLGTNSVFKGNIMALTSITITTGVNLEGRALARNGAVTLDSDNITGCTCQ
ncbi:MAG TPA: ice-binding family protein [Acidobacteriaceae bacterium]|nr:ice-binding family protein [Acidobacteriaceae bacterium]